MIRVVAKNHIKTGEKEKAITLMRELVDATRKEDGCVAYDVAENNANPLELTMLEAWETKEALDRHMASEHFTRLVPAIGALCDKAGEITLYTQVI